jgi:hypothetical protein
MDDKIFKKFLREGIEAHKNGMQKSVQEVFGKVASVDTGRGRRPASVRGDHDDEGDRTMPNFKEYSTSGCSEEEWKERVDVDGEDPKTVKCLDADEASADKEEEKLIWGLTSTNNPDSLVSLFKKYGIMSGGQAKTLIKKIHELSKDSEPVINLEEQIEGDRAEKTRVFKAKDTAELLQTIASFKLKKDVAKKLLRVLNLWGRMNTVRFESPAKKVQLWADEEPSGDDREAKLAAKEKEWDKKGLNKEMGEPIGADDEEYAEETPEETGSEGPSGPEATGEKEQVTLDFEDEPTEEIEREAVITPEEIKNDPAAKENLSPTAEEQKEKPILLMTAYSDGVEYVLGSGAGTELNEKKYGKDREKNVFVDSDIFSSRDSANEEQAFELLMRDSGAAKRLGISPDIIEDMKNSKRFTFNNMSGESEEAQKAEKEREKDGDAIGTALLALDGWGLFGDFLVPGTGMLADAAAMVGYALRRQWLEALFSGISIIPVLGDAIGKTGKVIMKSPRLLKLLGFVAKTGKAAGKLPKTVKVATKAGKAGKAGKKAVKVVDTGKDMKKLKGVIPEGINDKAKKAFESIKKTADSLKENADWGAEQLQKLSVLIDNIEEKREKIEALLNKYMDDPNAGATRKTILAALKTGLHYVGELKPWIDWTIGLLERDVDRALAVPEKMRQAGECPPGTLPLEDANTGDVRCVESGDDEDEEGVMDADFRQVAENNVIDLNEQRYKMLLKRFNI